MKVVVRRAPYCGGVFSGILVITTLLHISGMKRVVK